MTSLRGRLVRFIIGRVVASKFRGAGHSIEALRKLDAFITSNQKVPSGTDIRPVEANGIAGEWVRARGARMDRAILYLHGGACVMGSPATHRELAARLSAVTNASLFVLDYRLAPEHPFPAAMDDTIHAYRWLLTEGFAPKHLAIGGDSAGGGLALQTLITFKSESGSLPAAAFFLSPVTDRVRFDGESYNTCASAEPLNTFELSRFTATQYVGTNDLKTPLFYPASMNLGGLPPMCIHTGDREILLSDSVRLAERARDGGVCVDFRVWPVMWHGFQASARFVPEARRSLDEIGQFVVKSIG